MSTTTTSPPTASWPIFASRLADAPAIAFDTEFVSEDTYRPELCLIQVACGDRLAVIDTIAVKDMTPFWQWLVAPGHTRSFMPAARSCCFASRRSGPPPTGLFDLQIAAGLVGYEYPAGYGSLLFKLLGQRLEKGETRTDWRRRPLSERQIHVRPGRRAAFGGDARRAAAPGWSNWAGSPGWTTETAAWQDDVAGHPRPRAMVEDLGHLGLAQPQPGDRPRAVAVARKRGPAAQLPRPARAARRPDRRAGQAAQCRCRAKSVRSAAWNEGDLIRQMPRLTAAIGQALALPDAECPKPLVREVPSQITLLGQFISSALNSICRAANVAPSLVGTASDVRDLVAWQLDYRQPGRRNAAVGPRLAGRSRGPADRRLVGRQSRRPHRRPPLRPPAGV